MVAASTCTLAVAPLAYATAVNSCARKEGVWSWSRSEGINYAPALAAATVGIVLAQRATATAIAVACALTAKGCHTWCSILYYIKSPQRTSLFEQNAALALTSIFLAFLPSILNFLPLWSTVLHLSSSHGPRLYTCSD
ncbi:PREDICTED: probable cadmium/zinc-transporting ATPase HMA1, chloroplastic isoform X2 [Populus euphratica]|nr:PREDICTED: probable cadmium/zinc-transporting ATPase HMA1, chloroplastic isoform X2 [Populus euphratica]XP_011010214.1 PREDICTED: probable cadmium/zinc-transporting ATPase HMA1, chloroplastic isoform X2 [Populus euphratica]XP_011010215.1 PREDICTED: probable cadmium/zinc-transporting ATPase HMA1, chloroplastic isoform X2 [Populus euphratica]XP_011010216.1 PREDICTED: probable cadmium/zinc-transporting ATPase HMA1, chloroplastic isoform X2 [Populus euphratica]XP_011010218.1 PREDICTED: probable 